jgi:IS5 family transposase
MLRMYNAEQCFGMSDEGIENVDAASGLVRKFIGTAGNVFDMTQTHALLHDAEKMALADTGYAGVDKR